MLSTTRLDGSVDKDKRSEMVRNFNTGNVDVMLLSVRAGGAGLNLIGANCLILMDASWNPADDRQAMARVWRDGQQKPVFVYRLASLGTVEERVLLRQLGKESLLMDEKKEREEKKEAWLKAQENKQPDANAENGEKSAENEASEKPAAKPKVDEIPAEVLLTDRQREAIQSQKDKEERDKQRKEDIKRSEAYVKERELRQLVSDCANKFEK